MNYEREWSNYRNAVGFAAECARLALPFYDGDHQSKVVVAIEIAEHYANGEQIGSTIAYGAAADVTGYADRTANATVAVYAADAARSAALAAGDAYIADAADDADRAANATGVIYAARAAAHTAGYAGVDDSELAVAFARWVVRDLVCGRELPEELRQAAGAAIVAGDEALAQELLE